MIYYRYKITSKQNGQILGTGSFKVHKKMNETEQLFFLHEYTNGMYLKKEPYINIEINYENR